MPAARLSQAAQDLARCYMPFALHIAGRMGRRRPELAEEISAEALLGLVEAARDFRPERGTPFAVFARPRIWGRVRRAARAPQRPAMRSLGSDGSTDVPDRARSVMGLLSDSGGVLETLPPRLADLLRGVYLEGWTAPEAAAELGVTPRHVNRLHAQALGMLAESERN